MTSSAEILSAAMGLQPTERAEMAHQLLLSLESPQLDENADQAWAMEIRRRLEAIRSGRVVLRDWDDVLADVRQSILAVENP